MKCLTNNWKTQQITFFEKPFNNLLLKEECWCFEMWVDFTEVKVDASIQVKFAVVNMDGYETDEILSRALDPAEDVENDTIFITRSTFQNNEGIFTCIEKSEKSNKPQNIRKKLKHKDYSSICVLLK
jgi:hypothetical protein